jgi:hypothetical protein
VIHPEDRDYDPVVEAYKKDIDRTLLRANLKLTVTQRFERAMAHARFADELRRAGAELRARPRPQPQP